MEAVSILIKAGQTLEIIYLDREAKITQRRIHVRALRGEYILAICLESGAPRTFKVDNILAWQPIKTA